MVLTVIAKTNAEDLVIDYIGIRLKDGREVSLNWDESEISRNSKDFEAMYKGVCFDERYANGKIDVLKGMKVINIQTYSEAEHKEYPDGKNLTLVRMEFNDEMSSYLVPQKDFGQYSDAESA